MTTRLGVAAGVIVFAMVGGLMWLARRDGHAVTDAPSRADRAAPPTPTPTAPAPPARPRSTVPRARATAAEAGPGKDGGGAAETRPELDGRPRVYTEDLPHEGYRDLDPTVAIDNTRIVAPLKAADRALRRGDHAVALERAEEALRIDGANHRARVIAVQAACGEGDAALAQRHADLLDAMRYDRVRTACAGLGLELAADPRPIPAEARVEPGPAPPAAPYTKPH
jgi:hypothetical protein